MLVVELEGRGALSICARLLEASGAELWRVTLPGAPLVHPDPQDPALISGVQIFAHLPDCPESCAKLAGLLAKAQVIICSTDFGSAHRFAPVTPGRGQILCDLRADYCQESGDSSIRADWQIQALSGMTHCTGWPDQPPLPLGLPVVGYTAAFHAAGAILACALSGPKAEGAKIELSLRETAFVTMNSYLAGVLQPQGHDPGRVGNRHTAVAPWNAYPTLDGALAICAGNQRQWQALCQLMGQPDLARRFADQAARLRHVDEIDRIISGWTQKLGSQQCEAELLAAGIAAGRVLRLEDCAADENLKLRGMVQRDAQGRLSAGMPLGLRPDPDHVARKNIGHLTASVSHHASQSRRPRRAAPLSAPLAGLKVIEMGQFTTAPLGGRALATLGAQVLKIEKPGGDEQRGWQGDGTAISETFWMNNTGKESLCLDLTCPEGRQVLAGLLAEADLLIENFKPGTLARQGFDSKTLAALNPRLVHCAISGFGANSAYPGRAGFDLVIQAMSGFMAACGPPGIAVKSGASMADMTGAVAGVLASLAALWRRDQAELHAAERGTERGTGQVGEWGAFIDLSMQDLTSWLTAPLWQGRCEAPMVLRLSDGYFLCDPAASLPQDAGQRTRASLGKWFAQHHPKRLYAPVLSLREAAAEPVLRDSGLWSLFAHQGQILPVIGLPFRISGQRFRRDSPAPSLPSTSHNQSTGA